MTAVVELRCGRCRRVLRSIEAHEVPADWSGVVTWARCMSCYLPRRARFAAVAGRLAAEGKLQNVAAEMPWVSLRGAVAQGKGSNKPEPVFVGDPGNLSNDDTPENTGD